MTAPLTPPDPAAEPRPAAEAAADAAASPTPPSPHTCGGVLSGITLGVRYLTATPLVLTSLWLDACAETFRAASGSVSRLSQRVEGGPQ
jgi:hypothetical protein